MGMRDLVDELWRWRREGVGIGRAVVAGARGGASVLDG